MNDCLDPSRDDEVESLDSLMECCEMEKDCEKDLEKAQECTQFCFDPCVKDSAKAYLDCIHDENKGIEVNKRCSRQACLDGFLENLEDDADFSGDVLDLKNVNKRLKKIDQDDLEECGLMADFIEAACDIGDECCEKCTEELSVVVDCLINDIVIPFTSIELNTTIDECEIGVECELILPKSVKNRRTTAEEEKMFNKALNLPKQTKRDPIFEAAVRAADKARALEEEVSPEVAVDKCERQLHMNTIAYNVTYSVSMFMQCMTLAAMAALPETDEPPSGAGSFGIVAGLVATLAGTFFAL